MLIKNGKRWTVEKGICRASHDKAMMLSGPAAGCQHTIKRYECKYPLSWEVIQVSA